MYNFSGIIYRIWLTCGGVMLLGGICLLLKKPWGKNFKVRDCKTEMIMVIAAILFGVFYVSRIIFPDVSTYTGKYIDSRRKGSGLQIKEYVFWDGKDKKQVFSLDAFSKEEIYPSQFIEGQEYIRILCFYTSVLAHGG